MATNSLIKYNSEVLKTVANSITVTNKLLSLSEPQLIPYRKRDKWGFCTADKKIVIDCKYDEVERFVNGSSVFKKKGVYGILDKKGNEYLEGKYSKIQNLSDGLRAVFGKWGMGFIDENFNEVIPCKYEKVGFFNNFKEGMAKVKKNGMIGFLDTKGDLVVDFKYGFVNDFKDGLAIVSNKKIGYSGKKFGVIEKKGNEIIQLKYDWIKNFSEGLAANEINGKWGFIDRLDNQIVSMKYDETDGDYGFEDGFAGVMDNNDTWYFIDKNGNGIFKDKEPSYLSFASLKQFHNGYAPVCDFKWGIIDTEGNQIIDFKYNFIEAFHEGLALVKQDNRIGYVDINENIIIPFKYFDGDSFFEGLASVCIDEKNKYQRNYIDKKGIEYWED